MEKATERPCRLERDPPDGVEESEAETVAVAPNVAELWDARLIEDVAGGVVVDEAMVGVKKEP
jgi:hypothetical protein